MEDLICSPLVRKTYNCVDINHMKFAIRCIAILLFAFLPTITFAQDSKFFRHKLGKPSELYRSKPGLTVEVQYDDQGHACSATISPVHQTRGWDIEGLMPFVDELLPSSTRGKFIEEWEDIGNCTNYKYKDYERVLVAINDNACYDRWVLVYFKKDSCPKPPSPPNHTSIKK